MENISKELKIAIEAAKKGAEIALSYYRKEEEALEIKHKEDRSILTVADQKTEDVIKEHILSSFPYAEFITEEAENTTKTFENVWIIDPIDGIREFSKGIDYWAHLIAYAEKGEIKLGVCYFPALDLLLIGEKGKGAYLNGEKISVSKTSDFLRSFVILSSLRRFGSSKNGVLNLIDQNSGVRCYNSAFSGFCASTGKADVFVTSLEAKLWDFAPFVPIINEAGGKITDWNGNNISIKSDTVSAVFTNGLLHDEVLEMLNRK